jgi:hypothetical protein
MCNATLAPALFLLSDGMPNRGTDRAVLEKAATLRARGTLIVSCYVTDHDTTERRRLYGCAPPGWPDGANLLFNCASEVPEPSAFMDYLIENGWTVDAGGRFFAQINQSEVLEEFLNAVIGPAEQKQLYDEATRRRPAKSSFPTPMRTLSSAINSNGISLFYSTLARYACGTTGKSCRDRNG